MTRPRLLDLFCGAGGAAMGYHRAGFDVVGVDIKPQPRYPFEFHQGDAMTWPLDGYDAIHASPPCQAYTVASLQQRMAGKEYPDLVSATRARLTSAGVPWVIENVPGAPVRPDFKLCGCMFDLPQLKRERWFETSWHAFDLRQPCQHKGPIITVTGTGGGNWNSFKLFGRWPSVADWRRSMGIDWMTQRELSQAIPPPYTEHIGRQLLAVLERAA
jgi:DNA (cytosine-5)-methyltransferase 1